MSDLLKEIQDDLRRERLDNLWSKVGRFAIYGSIGIVALTAVFVVRDGFIDRAAEAQTTKLLRGSERVAASDYKSAVSIFSEIAEDTSSPSYPLAMLKKAQAQQAAGDEEGAKKTYAELAASKSEYAELARMHSEGKDAESDGVFSATHRENKAWALLASGDKEAAVIIFDDLNKAESTPRSTADRAKEVLRLIAPEKLK